MEDFLEELKNKPRPKIFRKIYLWWYHDGRFYHKYFKQGVKNIIYWFPIIWKDRNWHGNYIFEILKHKLKAQADYISNNNTHTRTQQDTSRMRLCASLIEKIQDEFYQMEYMEYHKEKIWFTPCNDGTGNSRYNSEEVWEKYDEYFKKYPLVYKKVLEGEGTFTLNGRDESDIKKIIAMNIAHFNQKRAQDLLFKVLNENINHWWD